MRILECVFVVILLQAPISAQPMTVCEVLRDAEALNGRQVSVRGVWEVGDLGQTLRPVAPCSKPTIRDGWIWPDVLSLFQEDKRVDLVRSYSELLGTSDRRHNKVIATIVGKFETLDHFEVDRLPGGVRRPRTPYTYNVGMIRFVAASELTVVPYTSEEQVRDMDWRRQPWAKPLPGRKK